MNNNICVPRQFNGKKYLKAFLYSLLVLFLLAIWCQHNHSKIQEKVITKEDIVTIPWIIPAIFFAVYLVVELNEADPKSLESEALQEPMMPKIKTSSPVDMYSLQSNPLVATNNNILNFDPI